MKINYLIFINRSENQHYADIMIISELWILIWDEAQKRT